jgi:hypothetical protein
MIHSLVSCFIGFFLYIFFVCDNLFQLQKRCKLRFYQLQAVLQLNFFSCNSRYNGYFIFVVTRTATGMFPVISQVAIEIFVSCNLGCN